MFFTSCCRFWRGLWSALWHFPFLVVYPLQCIFNVMLSVFVLSKSEAPSTVQISHRLRRASSSSTLLYLSLSFSALNLIQALCWSEGSPEHDAATPPGFTVQVVAVLWTASHSFWAVDLFSSFRVLLVLLVVSVTNPLYTCSLTLCLLYAELHFCNTDYVLTTDLITESLLILIDIFPELCLHEAVC